MPSRIEDGVPLGEVEERGTAGRGELDPNLLVEREGLAGACRARLGGETGRCGREREDGAAGSRSDQGPSIRRYGDWYTRKLVDRGRAAGTRWLLGIYL